MKRVFCLTAFLAIALSCAIAQGNAVDIQSSTALHKLGDKLRAEALKSPDGIADVTLEEYPGHFTMLTCRTRTGGAEEHAHYSDMFIVEGGDATLMTGGTLADARTISPGEMRGSSVVGGTPHKIATGDVIHISPNTPHQLVLAPGHHFLYYVIKVKQ